MNALIVNAVARALALRAEGRRVRRVGLLNESELALALAGTPEPAMLVLAVEPGAPHVRFETTRSLNRRLTDQLGDAPATLAGALIQRIAIVGCERVLHIAFHTYRRSEGSEAERGPRPEADLFFEMLPRTPFAVITADGTIIAAVRAPGTRRADDRRMARGGPYLLPFGQGTPADQPDMQAFLTTRLSAAEARGTALATAAGECLRGVAPAVIEPILAGALDAAAAAERLTLHSGAIAIVTGVDGEPELIPLAAGAGAEAGDPLPVLVEWARLRRARERAAGLRAAATRALKTESSKIGRARRALDADRAKLGDARLLRRQGETLLAHLHRVPRGAAAVELPDPAGGEAPIAITLDPRRSPAANAEDYFQSARRAERAREHLELRAQEIMERAAGVTEAQARISEVPDADLAAFVAELVSAGLVTKDLPELASGAGGRTPARSRAKAEATARLPYRSYALGSGWEVWVGRSNADNDVLTHELAHPRDLWLHVSGAAGSHVILRRADGGHAQAPAAVVRAAAAAAAHFSAARHSRLVPVIVTEKRYVRKPRRSPPGTAICLREKTMMVEPEDPARREDATSSRNPPDPRRTN